MQFILPLLVFLMISVALVGGIFVIGATVVGIAMMVGFFIIKFEITFAIENWKTKREKKCKEKRALNSSDSRK